MQGVCSAQTAGDCQEGRASIQPPVRAGERKPNLRALGSLAVFGLRLEGLTLKLEKSFVGKAGRDNNNYAASPRQNRLLAVMISHGGGGHVGRTNHHQK